MSNFFFTLFLVVFWCLGLTISSQEGYILYFLKKPFIDLYDSQKKRDKILIKLATPVILCITCMASVWGTTLYFYINQNYNLIEWVSVCLSASFIQTFIWKLYAKLD